MNQGWVKLHRQVLDNEVFRHDPTAWRVFEFMLLIVDHRSASWSGGRLSLALLVGMKDTTLYKALKRLEKAKMVTLASNNKYTTISICNWSKFQDDSNSTSNNKVTTKGQQSNTITRIEKERIKKDISNDISTAPHRTVGYLLEVPSGDIDIFAEKYNLRPPTVVRKAEELYHYCTSRGKTYKDYRAFLMGALSRDSDKLRESQSGAEGRSYRVDLGDGISFVPR